MELVGGRDAHHTTHTHLLSPSHLPPSPPTHTHTTSPPPTSTPSPTHTHLYHHHHHHQASDSSVSVSRVSFGQNSAVAMFGDRDTAGGTGSARRRRERRLRAYLRYARMSVAMALAESTHHSAPRGQKTARAGGEARVALHGHDPEAPLSQGRILRHVVGHLPAPSLDVPVPQMVDQLPDIEHFFAALSPDPEQVIEVPKILSLDVPMRAALRVTQLVEQLVEVPTTVSYSSLQRTVEQHVDIPVPGGRFSPKTAFNRVAFQKTHF